MSHSTSRIVLEVAARTHVGIKRSENEDRVLVADLEAAAGHVGAFTGRMEVGGGGALLAVCDGMGGEAGGEVASTTAVQSLYRAAVDALPGQNPTGAARGLLEAVRTASHDIETLAQQHTELSRMGTTATVCAVTQQTLLVAQVGDSRAYLLRRRTLRTAHARPDPGHAVAGARPADSRSTRKLRIQPRHPPGPRPRWRCRRRFGRASAG